MERKFLLRRLRDTSDPFSLEESIFIKNFRIPKEICWSLIKELEPYDRQKSSIHFVLRVSKYIKYNIV